MKERVAFNLYDEQFDYYFECSNKDFMIEFAEIIRKFFQEHDGKMEIKESK